MYSDGLGKDDRYESWLIACQPSALKSIKLMVAKFSYFSFRGAFHS